MIPRKLMDQITNPLEFVMDEDAFRELQDNLTDAIVALVTPGIPDERISMALNYLTSLRIHLYSTIDMRRAIDE